MNWPGQDRWLRLWHSARCSGNGAVWYEKLKQAYAEPQRHYHNQQHISECLAEFDGAKHLSQQPAAVELALWFHDAVYDPKAADNEERSAALAGNCLEIGGLPKLAESVRELIMATKFHNAAVGSDSSLMVDVDLTILGQGAERFTEYEAQIREEYRWVPDPVFKPKRAEILQRFLERTRIYTTDFLATKYEQQARRNLANSIGLLLRA
jgi:predicted metal-dependent HD superfamily phosphohydrolase